MKKISLIIIFYLIPSFLFSQNTLLLKSGEKLQGKLIEFQEGKLKFLFKNNLLTFNENEIVSVVFDSLSLVNESDRKERAIIKGVVTYYFNRNYGYKPDVGAKVYILNDKYLGEIDTLSIKNFIHAKLVRTIMSLGREQERREGFNELSKINAETESKFKELDKKSNDAVTSIQRNEKTIELSVDGNGSFSKTLKPGDYTVLIISKHSRSVSLTEVLGKIYLMNVKLTKNTEEVISAEFNEF